MNYIISETVFAYSVGAVGFLLYVMSSFFRGRSLPLGFEAAGCLLVMAQWLLLGEPVQAVLNGACTYVAICGILLVRFSWAKMLFPLIFPFILVIYALYGTGSMIETLALCAGVPSLAVRYLRDMNIVRGISLSSSALWVVVNVQAGVFVGAVCCLAYGGGHVLYFMRKYREGKAVKSLSFA